VLPTRFVKVAGGGNDFLLFEADGRALTEEDRRRLALACRRGLSVGADGGLFLTRGAGPGSVRVDYFNSDGSFASFCANGTRCAARYAVRHGLAARDPILETGWGPIPSRVDGDSVTLMLPELPAPGSDVRVWGDSLPSSGTTMPVGVPHLVVFIERDLENLAIESVAPPLRHHPDIPGGTNVNFVQVFDSGHLAVRSFERGIEGETLACGSGVVASAIVAATRGRVRPPILCDTRSGVAFTVAFTPGGNPIRDATLRGDAREVFAGELTEEAWQP
jgi:diaminopimelate epimerase